MKIRIHADKSELAGLSVAEQDALQANPEPWPISHVEVLAVEHQQKFTQRFLDEGITKGLIGIAGGKITVGMDRRPENADRKPDEVTKVVYGIVRGPGVYCCHCGKKLDAGNKVAQAHVATEHAGQASPDKENPSGYRDDRFYFCEKEG